MEDELEIREKEFRRINKELDMKTNDLLKQVNSALNSNNSNKINFDYNIKNPVLLTDFLRSNLFDEAGDFSQVYGEENNDEYKLQHEFLLKSENVDYKTNFDAQIINNSTRSDEAEDEGSQKNSISSLKYHNHNSTSARSNEAIIKCLNAKLKILTCELKNMKSELMKKDNCIKDLQLENKKISESKDKLNTQIINLKTTVGKLEEKIANHQTESQTRINENNSLKKDIDAVKKELKNANQQINNLDLRLNRSLENNDKLQNVIKSSQTTEKNLQDKIKKLENNERHITKNYERQISEILQAFKKQTLLIDNLKKQIAYLEASKQVELTREEFLKMISI